MKIIQNHKTPQILYVKDYNVNPAFVNEFQTPHIACRILNMELIEGELQGFVVDDEAMYLLMHIQIMNRYGELVKIYTEDFSIQFDQYGPYLPETYFCVHQQFQDCFTLNMNACMEGKLIFVISKYAKQIILRYLEVNEMEEEKTYKLKYNLK